MYALWIFLSVCLSGWIFAGWNRYRLYLEIKEHRTTLAVTAYLLAKLLPKSSPGEKIHIEQMCEGIRKLIGGKEPVQSKIMREELRTKMEKEKRDLIPD